jgi:hypothetical protein
MAIKDLTHQRCHNHMLREAVARCPDCSRFFCRECVTEHEDKVLCAVCLRKRIKATGLRSDRFQFLVQMGQFLFGIIILYLIFYYAAQILLALPSDFHEGAIWQSGWWTGS